jgi:hypothetical protein
MHRIAIIILGLLFVLPFPLPAQTAQENLTLEEAIRLSLENNLTLKQQEDRIRQAEAELKIQKTCPPLIWAAVTATLRNWPLCNFRLMCPE